MDEFRKDLEAILLKYGYESTNKIPTDDELLGLVMAMGDHISELEEQIGK